MTTLSDDWDDVNSGRRGDKLDTSTDDDDIVGNAVASFSRMRSLKYCEMHRLCTGLNGTTSNSL